MQTSRRFPLIAGAIFILSIIAFAVLAASPAAGQQFSEIFATFAGSGTFSPDAASSLAMLAAAGTLKSDAPDLAGVVKTHLERIGNEVKDFNAGAVRTMDEHKVRLHSLEQQIASLGVSGALATVRGSYSPVGSNVLIALQEEQQFIQAADAAGRRGKLAQFSARVNVDCSIRAALTNDGRGGSNDTGMPSNPERRGIVGPAMGPLRLLDVLPSRPVQGDAVEFVQLQVTGNADEQEEEGAEKAELDFSGELVRAEIATIAGWTPASKQVLSDHGALQNQVDLVIRNKVLGKLEDRLINGTGGAGKINGLLAQAVHFIPTIGTTPADVVGEALVRMANGGYRPNLVILNPLDWFRIQITKTNTEGEYVFGSPTMPVPPALWNTAIVPTPALAEGDFLALDTNYTTVLDREQMTVTISNSHADYFVRNLVAILGELRAGLEVLDEFAVYKGELPANS